MTPPIVCMVFMVLSLIGMVGLIVSVKFEEKRRLARYSSEEAESE